MWNVIVDGYEWSFFIGLIQAAFLNLSVFSMLQIINSSCDDWIEISSYILAFVFMIFMILFPYIIIKLALKFSENKGNKEFT